MNIVKKIPGFLHGGDYNPDQWLDYPDILEKDAELMQKAGCNTMSVGIFAWAALEPEEGKYEFGWLDEVIERLYKKGVYTVLATPSGARPAWMAQKYPEVLRVGADGKRILFSARHNHCVSSPVYREKVKLINTELAKRYSGNPAVILWHLSNEYNGEGCYCELCQENFRKWLKNKYKTIDALNHAWWNYFWSHNITDWSQINAPAPHGENSVHGLVLDWKRFVTEMTVDFMKCEAEPLKAEDPSLQITTNMMGFYEGLNYFKFKDICDVISWDNYPLWHSGDDGSIACDTAMAHDLMRSIKPGKPFLMMESVTSATNWAEHCKLKKPGMHELSSLQAIAHGSDSVQYFQWRKGRGGSEKFHGAVVDHCGHPETRVFREVAALGEKLEALNEICGTAYESKAAVICDTENRWAVSALQGLHNRNKGFMEELKRHYRPLFEKGVNTDLIDMESDLSGYKLIAAPMLYMLRGGISEKLKKFAEDGGTLVITYWSGIVNDTDLCWLGGFPGDGLTELTGICSEEIDTLRPEDGNKLAIETSSETEGFRSEYSLSSYCDLIDSAGAEVLGKYGSDFYKGKAAFTVNKYGKGKVYYIASVAEDAFYDDLYNKLLSETGLLPLVRQLPHNVYISDRTADDNTKRYIIQNFNTEDKTIEMTVPMTDIESSVKAVSFTIPAYGTLVLRQ